METIKNFDFYVNQDPSKFDGKTLENARAQFDALRKYESQEYLKNGLKYVFGVLCEKGIDGSMHNVFWIQICCGKIAEKYGFTTYQAIHNYAIDADSGIIEYLYSDH